MVSPVSPMQIFTKDQLIYTSTPYSAEFVDRIKTLQPRPTWRDCINMWECIKWNEAAVRKIIKDVYGDTVEVFPPPGDTQLLPPDRLRRLSSTLGSLQAAAPIDVAFGPKLTTTSLANSVAQVHQKSKKTLAEIIDTIPTEELAAVFLVALRKLSPEAVCIVLENALNKEQLTEVVVSAAKIVGIPELAKRLNLMQKPIKVHRTITTME